MIVRINATTDTHTAERLESLFKSQIEKFLDSAEQTIKEMPLNDPDRHPMLEGLKTLRNNITNDSPIEVIEAISWNWKATNNFKRPGASGSATIYTATENLDPADLGIVDTEIDKPNNQLRVSVEIS
jgi:hypothetical protein